MPAGGAAITNGFNFMDYLTSMNTDLDSAEPVDGADNSKTVNEDLSSTSAPSGIWESSVKDFCDGGEDDVEGKSFNIYCGESTGSTTTLPFGMNLKEFGVPDEYRFVEARIFELFWKKSYGSPYATEYSIVFCLKIKFKNFDNFWILEISS